MRIVQERLNIFRRKRNGHAFLAFRKRQLGAGKAAVFFGNTIEVNSNAICDFAYRNANATRAKIVTTNNHARHIRIAEQALYFAFNRRISFLHFCTTGA